MDTDGDPRRGPNRVDAGRGRGSGGRKTADDPDDPQHPSDPREPSDPIRYHCQGHAYRPRTRENTPTPYGL